MSGRALTLTRVDAEARDEWDDLVRASAQGTPFALSAFLDALGVETHLWLLRQKGRPVAGLPVLLRDGEPIAAPHPFTMYQGPLLAAEHATLAPHRRSPWTLDVLGQLVAGLAEQYPRLSFCTHPSLDDLRVLQWHNYHAPEAGRFRLDLHYTGVVDLTAITDFDAYLHEIRETRLHNYQRAVRSGVVVEETRDVDVLDRLHRLTFARQGIERPESDGRLLRAISEAALSNGFGEILVGRAHGRQEISATLFLHDQSTGYYLFAGSDPDARDLQGGTLILLENLRRCHARGLRRVDMVGINSPQRGDFKTSFNASPRAWFVASLQAVPHDRSGATHL